MLNKTKENYSKIEGKYSFLYVLSLKLPNFIPIRTFGKRSLGRIPYVLIGGRLAVPSERAYVNNALFILEF
jgi:hypothetical protein